MPRPPAASVAPPHIDFRLRAQVMHRRAQAAEADLARARRALNWYVDALRRMKNRERGQRARANRLHKFVDEVERLNRERDPLFRIIALGREFP